MVIYESSGMTGPVSEGRWPWRSCLVSTAGAAILRLLRRPEAKACRLITLGQIRHSFPASPVRVAFRREVTDHIEVSSRPETSVPPMLPLNRRLWISCVLLSLGGLGLGCAPDPVSNAPKTSATTELRKIKLLLNWFPEAEHGGFYAAQTKGFFRDAGLDVEIVPGGPNAPVVQQVAGKQVTFGVVNADNILLGRAQGTPVIALMAPIQISPRCLIVHEKSGIKSFEDIHDITLAMSSTNAYSKFLQQKYPFKNKNVRMVPYPGNVTKFLGDDQFAQQGYVFSEPFVIRQQGGKPHVLRVADVGFNPYTSCLITHEELIKEDPELVRKVVQASVKGWQEYLKDPVATNEHIHSINKDQMPLDVLAFGAEELKPLVEDPVAKKEGVGHMSLERWQQLTDQLVEIEMIKADQIKASEAFTDQFLK
jgi:NitT/TauT family transport system substrate-binding protein